ncbi:MAG: 30S ribosomal protein S20 [Kiritimatiellae bacterium]|nr:30S ribosomal protein S20 [Kiritimatiellia bacterium]
MPNIKSAAKRVKTAAKANLRNRSIKSELLTFRRKVEEAIAAGDKSMATAAVSTYASKLDKAAKRGVIKSNTADRKKARTAAALAKLA